MGGKGSSYSSADGVILSLGKRLDEQRDRWASKCSIRVMVVLVAAVMRLDGACCLSTVRNWH